MGKKRREKEIQLDPLDDILDDELDFDELEGDIDASRKVAVKYFINPKGRALFTLSELSSGEAKTLALLKTIADTIPDPILIRYVRNYVLMKRAIRRKGVKDIIAIVGGKAWRLLQNISLTRQRRIYEEEI